MTTGLHDCTISNGEVAFEIELRLGYEADNEAQNVEHPLLSGALAVSLRPDLPRTGELELFFTSAEAAHECRAALVVPGVWSLVDVVSELDMTWVRRGRLSTVQQDDRTLWVLRVGFREVIP